MSVASPERVRTGIEGLDALLGGGFLRERSYLVTGRSGTGKTIVGLHFLRAGIGREETCLAVNLEETVEEIREDAASLGIDLEGVEFLDLSPDGERFAEAGTYDVFPAGEVEGPAVSEAITERVDELAPDRVFVDPMSHLRDFAPDDHQFRTQASAFMRYLKDAGSTVVFTAQPTEASPDDDLQFLSDGTVELRRGPAGRTVSVPKMRGSATRAGRHTLRIAPGGLRVYPAMAPETHGREFDQGTVSSGVPTVDELLHGGIERGTVTILSGPTGVGKTTLGAQFMKEAAGRGERSVIYMFEESPRTFAERSRAVNIPTAEMQDRGTLHVEAVEPLARTPDEFAAAVREEVEERDARIVMIDGIDGYRLSLRGEEGRLERELVGLGRYLKRMGVAVIFVDATEEVTGEFTPTNRGVSYLADSIVFLRYLEIDGELRKAIGVLKKRTSDFERTLREFEITPHGIVVGEPLSGLRGILSGSPEFVGRSGEPSAGGRPSTE